MTAATITAAARSLWTRIARRAAAARLARACPDARLRLDAGLPGDADGTRRAISPLVVAWLH